MYYISKRIEIAFAHQLRLTYESKCQRVHGHNGIATIYCCAEQLDENGMVADFSHIKKDIEGRLDHSFSTNSSTSILRPKISRAGFAIKCHTAIRSLFKSPKAI